MLGVKKKEKLCTLHVLKRFLSFSRYDTQSHRLTDYPAEGHPNEVFPGQDYSNPRVKDFLSSKSSFFPHPKKKEKKKLILFFFL